MLICEELYLLLNKDDGKPESVMAYNGFGMNAAVLTDLMVARHLTLSEDKKPRIQLTSTTASPVPVLEAALQKLERKDGKRLDSVVGISKLCDVKLVTDSLALSSVLQYGERSFFGMGKEQVTIVDAGPETELRSRLHSCLHGQKEPSNEELALLSILHGLDLTGKILASEIAPLTKKQAKEKIKELAAQSPISDAVSKAVAAMSAAMTTAAIMPVVTGNSGS